MIMYGVIHYRIIGIKTSEKTSGPAVHGLTDMYRYVQINYRLHKVHTAASGSEKRRQCTSDITCILCTVQQGTALLV